MKGLAMAAMLVATDRDGFEAIYVDGVLRIVAEPVSARHMQKAADGVAVTIEQIDVPGVFGDEWPATLQELKERTE